MNDSSYDRAQTVLDSALQQWNTVPLRSIFSEIARDARQDVPAYQPPDVYLNQKRWALDPAIVFPQANVSPDPHLKTAFEAALERRVASQPQRLEQSLSLLHDYAWAVASPEEAVSLYDYARTEAAKAAAGDNVLLVGGDLSGVQKFIYTIAADKATKSLRGRSLYLQLLTDAVAQWLLHETKMPLTNLLYSGGGRFYVLVPAHYEAQIDEWRKQLGAFLLNVHAGELYVALGAATFAANSAPDFGELLREVNELVNADKRRRFAQLDSTQLHDRLFRPRGHGGNQDDRCVICGFMGAANNFEVIPAEDRTNTSQQQKRCRLCESLINLGGYLHDAFAIVRVARRPNLAQVNGRMPWFSILQALGAETWVINKEAKFTDVLNRRTEQPMRVQLVQTKSVSMRLDTLRDAYPQHSFEYRPIVNVTPRHSSGEVKSFGDLAEESVKRPDGSKAGVKRFGVLRMDVDDLGDIFGYNVRQASLARISTLSTALSRFFEGWVGEICRGADNRVYSVYSGGDDLFLVGSWDVLPAVAHQIQADLERYTGHNKLIHLSAGLTLHSEKFPLYQAAKAAADALDAAKTAPQRGELAIHKNALHFLDQTIAWECYPELDTLRGELLALVSHQAAARSLLQTLMQLYSQYQETLKSGNKRGTKQLFFGPWIWHGMYQLTRIAERYPKESAERQYIKELRNELVSKNDHPANITARRIEQAGLAARWVQLLTRAKAERTATITEQTNLT